MIIAISDEYVDWFNTVRRLGDRPKDETPEEVQKVMTEHVNEILAQHRYEWEQLQQGML